LPLDFCFSINSTKDLSSFFAFLAIFRLRQAFGATGFGGY